MPQFTPATEVDFVIIGSGAAGGIMAKQLSTAGLKVVVLEQGGWEMGISGQRVNSPFVAPMTKEYPLPPMPLKASGALFNTAASKLGLTVVNGPIAIISKPYMGRSACVNCGMCSGFGCHVKA